MFLSTLHTPFTASLPHSERMVTTFNPLVIVKAKANRDTVFRDVLYVYFFSLTFFRFISSTSTRYILILFQVKNLKIRARPSPLCDPGTY